MNPFFRSRRISRFWLLALGFAIGPVVSPNLRGQGTEAYEQPPIRYSASKPQDAVAHIEMLMAAGTLKWQRGGRETLLQLLRELGIPVESQMLVFSKSSFQRQIISPNRPRALYFSDSAYVGWVPGGLIEVATIDPQLGPIFYSFDPNAASPRFARDDNCMTCHGGMFVRGIPGVFVRSVFTDKSGEPLFRFGSEVVDYRTPFTNRWGGWYVTGRHGSALHRGNTLAVEQHDKLVLDPTQGANLTTLNSLVATDAYPQPGSDIVALLVFEHQLAMQNALTRAGLDCRRMLAYQRNLQIELKEPVTEELTYESVKSVFRGAAQDVVDALLFKDESKLPDGVSGSPDFQVAFRRGAVRWGAAGSLKDLELRQRLFRNRCSYMIYSPSFQSLPVELRRQIYVRLIAALRAEGADARYAFLAPDERARIWQILEHTEAGFKAAVAAAGKS